MSRLSSAEVNARISALGLEGFSNLLGLESRRASGDKLRATCPVHGKLGCMMLQESDCGKVRFFCFNGEGEFKGDAIDLVRKVRGCGFREALTWVGNQLTDPAPVQERGKFIPKP